MNHRKFCLFFVILSVLGWSAQAQSVITSVVPATLLSKDSSALFRGLSADRHLNLGVNTGITSLRLLTGGNNDFSHAIVSYGYGLSLRDQLSHLLGLQFDFRGGNVKGSNGTSMPNTDLVNGNQISKFSTNFWQTSLSGVINSGAVDYLHRKRSVSFFFQAGAGIAVYRPSLVLAGSGAALPAAKAIRQFVIPVGAGMKIRLNDVAALNLGYTENFTDGDDFDGTRVAYPTQDHYGYAYGGLEFTIGNRKKPNIDWVNPAALIYDEMDAGLRLELAALKTRVQNVQLSVDDLKKDADNDGVADQFDKCPGTIAGEAVDGCGCVIKFSAATESMPTATNNSYSVAYSTLQFEFDSSALTESSIEVLEATSTSLKANLRTVELDAYAYAGEHNPINLSKDRANAVKANLVKLGVDPKRILIKTFGKSIQVPSPSTKHNENLNQRVQFNMNLAFPVIPELIIFEANKAIPYGGYIERLNKMVSYLRANSALKIDLKGHTTTTEIPDATRQTQPDPALELSRQRVEAVLKYLTGKGIAPTRVILKQGIGNKEQPYPDDLRGQSLNRSVEIVAHP